MDLEYVLLQMETYTVEDRHKYLCKVNGLKNTFANFANCEINMCVPFWKEFLLAKKNVINAKRIFNKREQIGRKASCHNQRNFAVRTCVTICS